MSWLLLSVLSGFFESLSSVFGKKGAQKVNVLSVSWAQRFFALFVIFPLAYFTNSFQQVDPNFWLALFTTAILNTITTILFIKAIKDSPLSSTLPISTLTPIFLLISSPLMIGEFPKFLGAIGVITTVIGSYVLNLSKKTISPFEPLLCIFKEEGSRLMLIVAFIWSITSNTEKVGVQHSNPIIFSLASTSSILLFITIILIFKKISFKQIFQNSISLAPIGFLNGFAYISQMTAISMTIVPNVITVKRSRSLFGVILGKIFFKEEKITERLVGSIIMIIGIVLIAIS